MSHSCSLATLAVISVLSRQSRVDEDKNYGKQSSSNPDSMLQTAVIALAATYAVASSLSVAPSTSTSYEKEPSPWALESIPELADHSCDSSIAMEEDEESKLDMMEYTEAVKFDDDDKRAPLYAVEERNYAKTSWTRSISMSRAPRISSSKSLNNLSSMNYDEVPDMTACNSLMSFSSVSTPSPTSSTSSNFLNLKPTTTTTMRSTTNTTTTRSRSTDFFGLKTPARTTTNRVSSQRNEQWAIME